MNKKKKILKVLIIIGVILLIGLLLGIYKINKLNNKTTLSEDEFKIIMENLSYKVENITGDFSNYTEIKTVLNAYKEDEYEINYIIFKGDEYAKTYYLNGQSYFNQNKGKNYLTSYMNFSNYSVYNLTSDNNYVSIIRVKNTVIYINTESKYKKEIKGIIKKLNY